MSLRECSLWMSLSVAGLSHMQRTDGGPAGGLPLAKPGAGQDRAVVGGRGERREPEARLWSVDRVLVSLQRGGRLALKARISSEADQRDRKKRQASRPDAAFADDGWVTE